MVMKYKDNDICDRLMEKYYYLELNEVELSKISYSSYEDIDGLINNLITLVLNNNYNGNLITVDQNKLLLNYLSIELVYSDDIFDNLYQLRKLYSFFDRIEDKNNLEKIIINIINSSQILSFILENVFKYYPKLDFNDSYLMLLIDVYSKMVLKDKFDYETGDIGDSYSLYQKDIRCLDNISDKERLELLIKAKQGDIIARNKFIESNLKLVISVARYYRQYADFQDLIQCGNIGLIEACDKFDIEKGYRFSTYATWWIRREMIVFLNNNHPFKLPRNVYFMISKIKKIELDMINANVPVTSKEISIRTGIPLSKVEYLRKVSLNVESIDAPISVDDDSSTVSDFISADIDIEEDIISKLNRQEVYDIVLDMIKDGFIKKREADILLMRNGFINDKIYTFEEIGRKYNITKQRVEQIYTETLRRIRRSRYRFRFAGCLEDESIKGKLLNRRISK